MIILFVDIRYKLVRIFFEIYAYLFLRKCKIIYLNEKFTQYNFESLSLLFEAKQELLSISNKITKTTRNNEFNLKYCTLLEGKLSDLILYCLNNNNDLIYYLPMLPIALSLNTEKYVLNFLGKKNCTNSSVKFFLARFIICLGFYLYMLCNILKSFLLFLKLTANLFLIRKSKLVEVGKSPLLWLGVSPTEISDDEKNLSLQSFLQIMTNRLESVEKNEEKIDSILAITLLNQKIINSNGSIFMLKSIFNIKIKLNFILYFKLFLNILFELRNIFVLPLISAEKKFLIGNDIESLIYKYIFEVQNFKGLVLTFSYILELSPQMGMSMLSRPSILVNYSTLFLPIPTSYREKKYKLYQIEYGSYDYLLTWDDSLININNKNYSSKIYQIGPIMFCSPPPKKFQDYALFNEELSNYKNKTIISLFDLTPFTENILLSYDGEICYFNFDCVILFINDVIFACKQVFGNDFVLLMKPKRTPCSKTHELRYFDELNKIIKQNTNIILYEPNTNPWYIISISHLTISIPFTSVSNAAQYLGIPSCFYASKQNVKQLDEGFPKTVYGVSELKAWLTANCKCILLDDEYIHNNHRKVLNIIENVTDAITNIIQNHPVKDRNEK